MDSNLMCTACLDLQLQQGKTAIMLQDFVLGMRRTPPGPARCHLRTKGRMPADRQIDGCRITRRFAVDERQISFLNFAVLECGAEPRMRNIIFCHDQKTRSFLVEPVHDPGPAFPAHIRQILKVKKQCIGNRSITYARPRVYNDSGRLLDDGEILILEVDLERYLLGGDWHPIGWPEIQFDGFPASKTVASLILASVNANCA